MPFHPAYHTVPWYMLIIPVNRKLGGSGNQYKNILILIQLALEGKHCGIIGGAHKHAHKRMEHTTQFPGMVINN